MKIEVIHAYAEKRGVDERTVYTGNAPLAFGYQQWCDWVLNTHHQIVEFLRRLDVERQGVRKRVVNNSGK